MIFTEDWLTGFVIALLLSIPGGVWGQTLESDDIEQLDEVEVTAARIAPLVRSLPIPLPELSTAVPLPPDAYWKRGAPLAPDFREAGPQRLLQDSIALSTGTRRGPGYLEHPKPAYPKRAQKEGWQGRVLMEVAVRPDGNVEEVKVKESSGHPLLDQAAIAAVQGWRFAPERDGGFPLSGIAVVPLVFKLTDVEDEPLQ